jgi:hypothetical protein
MERGKRVNVPVIELCGSEGNCIVNDMHHTDHDRWLGGFKLEDETKLIDDVQLWNNGDIKLGATLLCYLH